MYTKTSIRLSRSLAAAALLASCQAIADSHPEQPRSVDEDVLVERVVGAVMQALEKDDFLQKQIEIGIQRYIAKQRAAQARAQAQRRRESSRLAESVRRVSPERDHIYGDPQAPISLIEYSDFECPYCKRFHPTAKKAVESYPGKMNWVYRHFPLGFHNPLAQKEAEASECAAEIGGNEAFWRYADAIYERTKSNGTGFPIDGLVPLAAELGLDEARFAECLKSERHAARVREDFAEGTAIGISGTPGNVLLDNRTGRVRVVAGAVPLARLRTEVDALLSASQ